MSNKSQYVNLEEGVTRYLHRERVNYIVDKVVDIKKRLGRSVNILDVGCGDGVVTKYLQSVCSKDDKIFALDSDKARIERARSYCSEIDFRCGYAEELDFGGHNFDIVLLHHVIEHVRDDEEVLKECRRVLKNDGYLILGFPNEGCIIGKILQRIHRNLYKKSKHLRFYSIESMRYILQKNRFIVEEYAKFGLLFPFYYMHLLLLMNRVTFEIGSKLAKRFDFLADSVIFLARK